MSRSAVTVPASVSNYSVRTKKVGSSQLVTSVQKDIGVLELPHDMKNQHANSKFRNHTKKLSTLKHSEHDL